MAISSSRSFLAASLHLNGDHTCLMSLMTSLGHCPIANSNLQFVGGLHLSCSTRFMGLCDGFSICQSEFAHHRVATSSVKTFRNTKASCPDSGGQPDYTPLVKMCGVTNVSDAVIAAKAGAHFVGMILWPKSKRSVSSDVAKAIADAAREHGAKPVGVFVDEDAKTIEKICIATGITFAQLHGDGARSALQFLPSSLHVIYTLNTDKEGIIQTALPDNIQVDWILIDSLHGGSGEKFNWQNFNISTLPSRHGWLLAGGLTPENVAEAVTILKPDAVDVSSGISGADGILKDPARVARFMDAL